MADIVIEEFEGSSNSGYENDSYLNDTFICGHTESLQQFHAVYMPLIYSVVFVLGIAGNGLMVMVLMKRIHLLRITEIYLLHLAFADLLLLLTFPFVLVQVVTGWVFGDFVCKMVGLLNRLNFLCGSLLLACIGFDRYLAIVHAIPSMQSRRPRTVHLTCMVLWLVCSAISAPNVVFLSVTVNPTNTSTLICFYNSYRVYANNWRMTNRFITHVFCFFLPLAVMTYCYTVVVLTLRRTQRSQEKQRAIRLALLVTAVFCLCWLPYNLTMLVDTMKEFWLINQSCEGPTQLQQALVVTESLGFLHCCLNPFLYAFVGVRFRNDLARLFSRWGCGRVCLSFIRAEGHTRSSISEGALATSSIAI